MGRLLRLVAGLEEPTSGKIFFDDRDFTHVPTQKRNTAVVPQTVHYLQNRGAYEKFIDLTIRHRVSLVISGHVHSGNSTVVIDGTYFVTTRTLGGSIDTSHGFREVVVYPDGRVEVGEEVLTYKNFAVVTWGSRGLKSTPRVHK